MIRLKLNEMLKTRGLTAYGLHVKSKGKGKKAKARLHQSVISKIRHNKSKALQLDILDVLCELLNCQPADLIVYESTTQSAPTTQIVERATTQTAKHTQNTNTTQTASDNEYDLTVDDVVSLLESNGLSLKSRTVREKAKKGELHGKQGKQNHWFFRHSDVSKYWVTRGKE
jgi:DNA-binding Xre family transcriptional regulator